MTTLMSLASDLPRSEEEVNIFGALLFTDEHAHVKKALNDNDYWKAFDEVSGPRWPVFAIRAKKGKLGLPKIPRDVMGYMVPVWKEPSANKAFLDELEVEDTQHLPMLVVFAKGPRGELLKRELRLTDDSEQAVYVGLKEALRLVSSALEGVLPENRGSGLGTMQAVHMAVDRHDGWAKVKKGISVYHWLKRCLP